MVPAWKDSTLPTNASKWNATGIDSRDYGIANYSGNGQTTNNALRYFQPIIIDYKYYIYYDYTNSSGEIITFYINFINNNLIDQNSDNYDTYLTY